MYERGMTQITQKAKLIASCKSQIKENPTEIKHGKGHTFIQFIAS